jgi:seryl-tRNA synthetase
MLDTQLLRKDLDGVVAKLATRKDPQPYLDVDAFRALEAERKAIQTRTEALQSQRNTASKQIGQRKAKGESADDLMAEVASIKDELEQSATRLDALQQQLETLVVNVPNLPHESVPVGADENANVEVRRWAPHGLEPRRFDFPVKDHVDLGEPLGLSFETGAKLAGTRFSFMKGPMARLHRVLHALHRQRRIAAWHGPAAQVRGRPVRRQEGRPGGRGRRLLPYPHGRGHADQQRAR